ncbi:MAG: ATP-binding protein [Balneolales bacterium]
MEYPYSTHRMHEEDILKNIAEGVSAETGEAFFKSLVKHLCKSLCVDYAMVCEIIGDHMESRVIAQQGMKKKMDAGTIYDFENTPSGDVLGDNNLVCYPSGVPDRFTHNEDLATLNVCSFIGMPLHDSNKQLIGHLAIMHNKPIVSDLSIKKNMVRIFATRASAELERRHYEQKIIIQKNRAEEMNRLKTNFLANMSHEIRTPMNSILGFATLLEEQLSGTELGFFTSRIKQSGERLLNTINDLLDLAKIESRKMDVNLACHNVSEQVEVATGLMGGIAIQKNISLITSIRRDDLYAELDPHIFGQILNNTIGNALKFTEKGHVEVSVDAVAEKKVNFVRIAIRDTGIGIEKDFLDQVFDEFKQESEGLSRRFEGTGLGLTITKKFVELLNGTIMVDSKKGEGTSFTILLPAVSKTPETEKKINKNMSDPIVPEQTGYKPKILLVEDNDENKDVTKLILKNHYNIDSALDGESAIEKVKEEQYSAILMDINLGRGLTGTEVKSYIKQLPGYEGVPIIAITAYAMRGDRLKYLQEGFDSYLAKPFSKEDLIEVISSAISCKRL